jgi:large subunit ribosomal protein L3
MSIGLVGRKGGMTRIFTESGSSVPVTVVEVLPNKVTQVKTVETDGYSAVQITTGSKKSSHLSKSEAGHYAKAGLEAGRMQDATHGNSLSHRAPGSIGQCQTPGRVWKGKKMSGQMGNERVTTQGLEVVKIDTDNNLILIKGAVPGATGADVIISPTVKSKSSSEG